MAGKLHIPDVPERLYMALVRMLSARGARYLSTDDGGIGHGAEEIVSPDITRELMDAGLIEYGQPGRPRISYLGRRVVEVARERAQRSKAVALGFAEAPLHVLGFAALRDCAAHGELGRVPGKDVWAKGKLSAHDSDIQECIARGLLALRPDGRAVRLTNKGRAVLVMESARHRQNDVRAAKDAARARATLDAFKGKLGPERASCLRAMVTLGTLRPKDGNVAAQVYEAVADIHTTYSAATVQYLVQQGYAIYTQPMARGYVAHTRLGQEALNRLHAAQRTMRRLAAHPMG